MRVLNSGVAVLLWTAVGCSAAGDDGDRGARVGGGSGGFSGAAGAAGAGGLSGAGAVGGAGSGAGGAAAISGNCDEFYLDAEPGVPNFLIVLDKSGSMGGEGTASCGMAQTMVDCMDPANFFQPACIVGAIGGVAGGVDRWTPSVSALKAITAMLEGQMRFGLMTYPGGTDNCGVGELKVSPAYNTAAAIAAAVDGTCPGGATPTAVSLREAETVFDSLVFGPDEKQGVPYVLLVTDGEPNCAGGGQGGFGEADEQGSYEAVTALADAGIRTYVIGYDTKNDATLAGVLDEMARRGNTGDAAHRPVEDEASLVAAFTQIAATAVSCSYKLEMEPADPSFVRVKVDGAQKNYNEPNGWSLNGDTIVLQGDACSQIQDGGTHSLDVQVTCTVVTPQ
jgi:hypothetical protein